MAGIKVYAADDWFSKAIRHRAGYKCEHCLRGFEGLVQGFECAHIWGRANRSTRWDIGNAVALCSHCHRFFTENPMAFHAWLSKHLGEGHLELLNERRRAILKTNTKVRAEIAKHYRDEYRRMTREGTIDLVGF